MKPLSERQLKTACDGADLLLVCLVDLLKSLVCSCDDEILETFDVVGINNFLLDLNALDLVLAGNDDLNELAACSACKTHFLDLSLSLLYLSLHSLSLGKHVVHVASHTHSAESALCHIDVLLN